MKRLKLAIILSLSFPIALLAHGPTPQKAKVSVTINAMNAYFKNGLSSLKQKVKNNALFVRNGRA